MRLPDRLRVPDDPLLRFGVAAMAFALACAGLLAAYALLDGGSEKAKAEPAVKASASEPLTRSDPGVDPLKEEDVPPPRAEREPEPEAAPEPAQKPTPAPPTESAPAPQPEPQPEPEPQTEADPASEPEPERAQAALPVGEADWPMPTDEQVEAARGPRRYDLPPGAPLGLTVRSIGLYDVPILRSDAPDALDKGVVHARGSSMPWSDTPERNVYLAGHRLGWPGTGSHLIFYRLDELDRGDEIVLKDRDGKRYLYRVTESFAVKPTDTWVMGRLRGEDMLTLQTCTPIPGFEKRLIVRAERV